MKKSDGDGSGDMRVDGERVLTSIEVRSAKIQREHLDFSAKSMSPDYQPR